MKAWKFLLFAGGVVGGLGTEAYRAVGFEYGFGDHDRLAYRKEERALRQLAPEFAVPTGDAWPDFKARAKLEERMVAEFEGPRYARFVYQGRRLEILLEKVDDRVRSDLLLLTAPEGPALQTWQGVRYASQDGQATLDLFHLVGCRSDFGSEFPLLVVRQPARLEEAVRVVAYSSATGRWEDFGAAVSLPDPRHDEERLHALKGDGCSI